MTKFTFINDEKITMKLTSTQENLPKIFLSKVNHILNVKMISPFNYSQTFIDLEFFIPGIVTFKKNKTRKSIKCNQIIFGSVNFQCEDNAPAQLKDLIERSKQFCVPFIENYFLDKLNGITNLDKDFNYLKRSVYL